MGQQRALKESNNLLSKHSPAYLHIGCGCFWATTLLISWDWTHRAPKLQICTIWPFVGSLPTRVLNSNPSETHPMLTVPLAPFQALTIQLGDTHPFIYKSFSQAHASSPLAKSFQRHTIKYNLRNRKIKPERKLKGQVPVFLKGLATGMLAGTMLFSMGLFFT